jgi:DNA-binding response OmpR family regulator
VETCALVMLVNGTESFGIERIRLALFNAGYRVTAVESPDIKKAIRQNPDIIIANLSDQPTTDLEMCQLLSRMSQAPIVTICSGADEAFRVGLLESIIDDYLIRPVNPRELIARIRNILRRKNPSRFFENHQHDEIRLEQESPKRDTPIKGIFHNITVQLSRRRLPH